MRLKACRSIAISRTRGENWGGTDFKIGVGATCSECGEWSLRGGSIFAPQSMGIGDSPTWVGTGVFLDGDKSANFSCRNKKSCVLQIHEFFTLQ